MSTSIALILPSDIGAAGPAQVRPVRAVTLDDSTESNQLRCNAQPDGLDSPRDPVSRSSIGLAHRSCVVTRQQTLPAFKPKPPCDSA